jgi:hypothetical protein
MRVYLGITATVFGLLTVVHIWRMTSESVSLARDPWFLLITLASAALCFWSVRLLLAARKPQ